MKKRKENKKGISLIVLIITIIVIIILASAIILTFNLNNPIQSANKTLFVHDVSQFVYDLEMYKASEYAKSLGIFKYDELNIATTDTNLLHKAIPSLAGMVKYANKFEVKNGFLRYIGDEFVRQEWAESIHLSTPITDPSPPLTSSTEPEEIKIGNEPVLAPGMTPVKWDDTGNEVDTTINDETWYNYEENKWANTKTEDGSMWVWIPRYEYKIQTPHSSTAQVIDINFLEGTNTTPTSGYIIHPAFTFGSDELKGIWVSKFEASGTLTNVETKPNASALRNITISQAFTACRSMETNNVYGWGTIGEGIDSHLMKNVEWGAVAYLSSSIYGKTDEVWINPSITYITGCAGASVSESSTATTYPYNNLQYGINASTTGNVYGVYDMSGCSYEYTAAYVNNSDPNLITYGEDLVNADLKYKDVYSKATTDTGANNYGLTINKKGDAIYETSTAGAGTTGWYGDYSYMPYTGTPFFIYGRYCNGKTGAGLFSFFVSNGYATLTTGFRPVLVVN